MNGQLSRFEMEDIVRTALTDNISALEDFSGIKIEGDIMLEANAWDAAEQYLGELPDGELERLCNDIENYLATEPYRIKWRK